MESTMNMPKIIVMVGLPGSGKDYWIEQYLKENPGEYYIASTDAIIEAVAAEKGLTYSDVFGPEEVKNATAQMNAEVAAAIREQKNVIWNQTNMAAKKRKGILSRFPKHTYLKMAVVVTAPPALHMERLFNRAKLTGKFIPPGVIEIMRQNYVEPSRDEGFDEIVFVSNV